MNIIQQADLLKGVPDQALQKELLKPSGSMPSYLVLSELKRRKDVRDSFGAMQKMPETSIAEEFARGIGGADVGKYPDAVRGAMPGPALPTSGSPAMASPQQASSPMGVQRGFAVGGPVTLNSPAVTPKGIGGAAVLPGIAGLKPKTPEDRIMELEGQVQGLMNPAPAPQPIETPIGMLGGAATGDAGTGQGVDAGTAGGGPGSSDDGVGPGTGGTYAGGGPIADALQRRYGPPSQYPEEADMDLQSHRFGYRPPAWLSGEAGIRGGVMPNVDLPEVPSRKFGMPTPQEWGGLGIKIPPFGDIGRRIAEMRSRAITGMSEMPTGSSPGDEGVIVNPQPSGRGRAFTGPEPIGLATTMESGSGTNQRLDDRSGQSPVASRNDGRTPVGGGGGSGAGPGAAVAPSEDLADYMAKVRGMALPDRYGEMEAQNRQDREKVAKDRQSAKGEAILEAGLAMMAGESPWAAVNVGRGGMAGMRNWREAQRELRLAEQGIRQAENQITIARANRDEKQLESGLRLYERAKENQQRHLDRVANLGIAADRNTIAREQIGAQSEDRKEAIKLREANSVIAEMNTYRDIIKSADAIMANIAVPDEQKAVMAQQKAEAMAALRAAAKRLKMLQGERDDKTGRESSAPPGKVIGVYNPATGKIE